MDYTDFSLIVNLLFISFFWGIIGYLGFLFSVVKIYWTSYQVSLLILSELCDLVWVEDIADWD